MEYTGKVGDTTIFGFWNEDLITQGTFGIIYISS